MANGKYIMFCDSDDYVSSQWCEVMHETIEIFSNSLVVCDVLRTSRTEELLISNIDYKEKNGEDKDYFQIYKLGVSAYCVNKIYRKDIIIEHGIYFDEKCSFSEDVKFNVKYYKYCEQCRYIDMKLYAYFRNTDSVMNRYYREWMGMHLQVFSYRLPIIDNKSLNEYCDIWLYQFLHMFDNVFDSRNTDSFIKKMRYNQKMITSKEFQFCLQNVTPGKENPKFIKLLQMKNYYFYWGVTQLLYLRNKIRRTR